MLKQIKTLGLVITIGSIMVGCNEVERVELQDTNTTLEESLSADYKLGKVHGKKWHEEKQELNVPFTMNDVIEKCAILKVNGKIEDPEEYFKGVLEYTDYHNGPSDSDEYMTDQEALDKMMSKIDEEIEYQIVLSELEDMEEKLKEHEKSVEETEKEETTEVKEKPKQEEKKEVVKEEPQEYCEWCETNTDHNSNDHIGQCYDCGEEMQVYKMDYNGRSFHCGCENDRISCGYCGTSVIRKIAYKGEYCNQQCYDSQTYKPAMCPEGCGLYEYQCDGSCKEVYFDCVWCGRHHSESESYYNEDGLSACSEECFNNYTGNN